MKKLFLIVRVPLIIILLQQEEVMATASGEPIPNFRVSQTVGPRGPLLLQDHIFFNTMGHLNRARIPERVAHARGAGAHGYFEVTHDITKYCAAKLFSEVGKKTPIFVRFSTATGELGSADTRREHRGFAIKFYTEEGNWDLVGNNVPVFIGNDAIIFTSSHGVGRRNPSTNLRDPNAVWDFVSLTPEAVHQTIINNSDRGIPDGYRFMHGFSISTYMLVNDEGASHYVRFTFRTNQGIRNLTSAQGTQLAGSDPQYSSRDLFTNIAEGNFPSWTFYVQLMTVEEADNWRMNPFDNTKVWPHKEFPLVEVGQLILNRNLQNDFDESEQSAFSPANLVPGIRPSPDRVLAARMLFYSDAQRYRLGVNHEQLPINAPLKKPTNYLRGGLMNYISQGSAPNYFPNSRGGPVESERAEKLEGSYRACGDVKRHRAATDPFVQPREFWNRVLDDGHKRRTVVNIVSTLRRTQPQIQKRVVNLFSQVSPDMGEMIEEELRRQPA